MQTNITDMYNTNPLENKWWDCIDWDGDFFSLKVSYGKLSWILNFVNHTLKAETIFFKLFLELDLKFFLQPNSQIFIVKFTLKDLCFSSLDISSTWWTLGFNSSVLGIQEILDTRLTCIKLKTDKRQNIQS